MTDDEIVRLGAKLAKARETIEGLLFAVTWARDSFDLDSGTWHFFNGALEKYSEWEDGPNE